jgi:hypothetical protein
MQATFELKIGKPNRGIGKICNTRLPGGPSPDICVNCALSRHVLTPAQTYYSMASSNNLQDHGYFMSDIEEGDEHLTATSSSRFFCPAYIMLHLLYCSSVARGCLLIRILHNRSESIGDLGDTDWQNRCQEDGQRLLIDLASLPYARGSHGAPLVRSKIVEALESVGKLREGTCDVYNNGLYNGGLFNIKPSGRGMLPR